MREFLTGFFVILFTCIRGIAKGMAFIANHGIGMISDEQKNATRVVVKPKAQPVSTTMPKKAVVVPTMPTAASATRDPLVLRTAMDTLSQEQLKQRPPLPVASRTVVIALEAQTSLPFGKAWMYLYKDQKLAKRVLKIQNSHLAKVICGPGEDRYFFKDVEYLEEQGTQAIQDQFIKEIQQLLYRKKATQEAPVVVKVAAPPATAPVVQTPVAQMANVQRPLDPVRQQLPVRSMEQPAPSKPVNRSVKGAEHIGTVVSAGKTTKVGPNGTYETFCVTLNDGFRELPFNGAEIERLCRDMGIQVGERIKVVDMGKMDVYVPGVANPRQKNLYQITRLGAN
jgi:hypothetical protein